MDEGAAMKNGTIYAPMIALDKAGRQAQFLANPLKKLVLQVAYF